jgi:hypothetical protein
MESCFEKERKGCDLESQLGLREPCHVGYRHVIQVSVFGVRDDTKFESGG